MNFQLHKCKEFKQDENKKFWKSCVKFSELLMVKKSGDQRYQIYDDDITVNRHCFPHKTTTPI